MEEIVKQRVSEYNILHSDDASKIQICWRAYQFRKKIKIIVTANKAKCKLKNIIQHMETHRTRTKLRQFQQITHQMKMPLSKIDIPTTPIKALQNKRKCSQTPGSSKSYSSKIRPDYTSKHRLNTTYDSFNDVVRGSAHSIRVNRKSHSISHKNKSMEMLDKPLKKTRKHKSIVCKNKNKNNENKTHNSKYVDAECMTEAPTISSENKISKMHYKYMLEARLCKIEEESKSTNYSPEKASALKQIDANSPSKHNRVM